MEIKNERRNCYGRNRDDRRVEQKMKTWKGQERSKTKCQAIKWNFLSFRKGFPLWMEYVYAFTSVQSVIFLVIWFGIHSVQVLSVGCWGMSKNKINQVIIQNCVSRHFIPLRFDTECSWRAIFSVMFRT